MLIIGLVGLVLFLIIVNLCLLLRPRITYRVVSIPERSSNGSGCFGPVILLLLLGLSAIVIGEL